VEGLVTYEFVGETEALGVDHPILAEDDGIVERGAEAEAARPELLDVAQEPEGAGPRQLLAEAVGGDIDGDRLPADERIGEIDLDLDARTVIGTELGEGFAEFDAHRLVHFHIAPLGGEMRDARLVDGVEER